MSVLEKTKAKMPKVFYIIMLILVVCIWGIVPNISKFLLGHYSPAAKTAFAAAVAFFALLLISAKKLKSLNKSYFKIAVPTGIFYSSACVLQQIGLSKTTPTMYAFLENLSCLVVPFLVWYMTRRRPSYFKFAAAILCVVSVYILGGAKLDSSLGLGNILCGLAGIFYGVNIAVTGIKARGLDAMLYLLVQFGVHFVISTVYALFFEDIVFSFDTGLILLSVGITLVSTVLGWILRTICLQNLDATFVSVVMPFASVITTVISIISGNDTVSVFLVSGVIIGLAAAFISDFEPKNKKE